MVLAIRHSQILEWIHVLMVVRSLNLDCYAFGHSHTDNAAERTADQCNVPWTILESDSYGF